MGDPIPGSESYGELARLRSAADPERDARRAAYQERERRRAARALDRYIEVISSGPVDSLATELAMVAGERFVEAVGDYVLSNLQQKSHYGASCGRVDCPGPGHLFGPRQQCAGPDAEPEMHAEGGHDL